jgi:YggT family protein
MAALNFIVNTLISLLLLVVLLRLLLQWSRADFRNPLARSLVQITNPVLVPLRRVLPSVGRIDTASVVVILALALLRVALSWLMLSSRLPATGLLLQLAALELLRTVLWTYFLAILFYSLLSMLSAGQYNPAQGLLATLCEPLLRPLRRLIPPLGGLDLSPLWVCIAIQATLILLA